MSSSLLQKLGSDLLATFDFWLSLAPQSVIRGRVLWNEPFIKYRWQHALFSSPPLLNVRRNASPDQSPHPPMMFLQCTHYQSTKDRKPSCPFLTTGTFLWINPPFARPMSPHFTVYNALFSHPLFAESSPRVPFGEGSGSVTLSFCCIFFPVRRPNSPSRFPPHSPPPCF